MSSGCDYCFIRLGLPFLMAFQVIFFCRPLTQVVFPLVVNKDEDFLNTDNGLNYPSPTKRSRYVDVSPLHVTQTGKR